MKRPILILVLLAALVPGCADGSPGSPTPAPGASSPTAAPKGDPVMPTKPNPLPKTDAEWKKVLTPEQYRVMREKGTERAFTGKYGRRRRRASTSAPRAASRSSRPTRSSTQAAAGPLQQAARPSKSSRPRTDVRHARIEITCAKCGAHQGHVFNDGPGPRTCATASTRSRSNSSRRRTPGPRRRRPHPSGAGSLRAAPRAS